MPLSLATYGNRIYASDKMSNLVVLDEETGDVLRRVENIAIYIHQLAWPTVTSTLPQFIRNMPVKSVVHKGHPIGVGVDPN